MSEQYFRPQNSPKVKYHLNPDARAGLKSTVKNNQPLMALEYISTILEEACERIDVLESKLASIADNSQKPLEFPAAANSHASEIVEGKSKPTTRKSTPSVE